MKRRAAEAAGLASASSVAHGGVPLVAQGWRAEAALQLCSDCFQQLSINLLEAALLHRVGIIQALPRLPLHSTCEMQLMQGLSTPQRRLLPLHQRK